MIQFSLDNLDLWLPVVDWEGFYEVSFLGGVRSLPRRKGQTGRPAGNMLQPSFSSGGYPSVTLAKPGKRATHAVHRLVLAAFVGPCPTGKEGRHLDDVKTHNALWNLAYGSSSANAEDSVRNGTHYHASKTHCDHHHEFTPDNTIVRENGWRDCRACLRRLSTESSRRIRQQAREGIDLRHTCPVCGALFQPRRRDGIYCSPKCGEASRRPLGPLAPRVCPGCGSTFTPKRKRTAVCCSGKCREAWRRRQQSGQSRTNRQ